MNQSELHLYCSSECTPAWRKSELDRKIDIMQPQDIYFKAAHLNTF